MPKLQPYGNVEFFHLFSDDITAFPDQIHVPRLREALLPGLRCSMEILRAAFRNFDFIFVKRIFQRISGGYHLPSASTTKAESDEDRPDRLQESYCKYLCPQEEWKLYLPLLQAYRKKIR